ncbi:MAG: amidohydrolase [Bryobacteraceae bacterium]|nr:amidohydrolase [Bryobacteraceae bacterium]MDW8377029.1 amidohydrolase family protein [Bryobacterales bacterium]
MNWNRRDFLFAGAGILGAQPQQEIPIIDIHQHTNYSRRPDEALVAHQRKMGVSKTILLPAGRKYGLAAQAGGNDSVVALARQYPKEFYFFANELPDIPETRETIEKYLKMGAIGIGEQKFPVDCDSKPMQLIAEIARDYKVPVLLHFQHEAYNYGIERFHKMLEKYPTVNFIGHAQTFWSNIHKGDEQVVLYPIGKVTPGGITDRLLADYPNMFGDLSAGSGLNALRRDPDHAREFLKRHQDKLLYGSDCNDSVGAGPKCSGSLQLAQLRELCPDRAALRKILSGNAERLFPALRSR